MPLGSGATLSRQTQFDFNRIMDREYKYFAGSSDDGWLAGGGEDGGATRLAA